MGLPGDTRTIFQAMTRVEEEQGYWISKKRPLIYFPLCLSCNRVLASQASNLGFSSPISSSPLSKQKAWISDLSFQGYYFIFFEKEHLMEEDNLPCVSYRMKVQEKFWGSYYSSEENCFEDVTSRFTFLVSRESDSRFCPFAVFVSIKFDSRTEKRMF